MKKNILQFGSLAGGIMALMMIVSSLLYNSNPNFQGSMLIGFGGMLISFAIIFVGIKKFRDKHNEGALTFGKAFKMGLLMTLIASTFYVVIWLIEYYFLFPDFMEKYTANAIAHAEKTITNAKELKKQVDDLLYAKEMYKNPAWVIVFTYMEVLPLGIIATLVTALILKRKAKVQETV